MMPVTPPSPLIAQPIPDMSDTAKAQHNTLCCGQYTVLWYWYHAAIRVQVYYCMRHLSKLALRPGRGTSTVALPSSPKYNFSSSWPALGTCVREPSVVD